MAKYRKIRADIFEHHRTEGIGAIGRDILMQGILASIAGLLERSVRKMALTAGVDEAVVEATLAELQRRGCVRWWPDLEILWVIGAAEEQAQGEKAWRAVLSELQPRAAVVRASFAAYYQGREKVPEAISAALRDMLADTISPRVDAEGFQPADMVSPQEAGNRSRKQEQEQEQEAPPRCDAASPPPLPPDEDDLDDPDVRTTGVVVHSTQAPEPDTPRPRLTSAEQALFELAQHHGAFVASLPAGASRERAASSRPTLRDDAGHRNLLREVEKRGLDGVLEVLRFGWGEVAAGRWPPDRLAFAFAKSGGWFDKLVGERADAMAKAEAAEKAAMRREELERAEQDRAAKARAEAPPGGDVVDIEAVTKRLRSGRLSA